MSVGTCVNLVFPIGPGEEVVSCGVSHDAELFGIAPANCTCTLYPGATALSSQAWQWCQSFLQTYEADTGYYNLRTYYIYPSSAAWASGDTLDYCFLRAGLGNTLTRGLQSRSIY